MRRLAEAGGQDTLEYLIAVGAVVLVLVGAFLAFDVAIQLIVGLVCPAVDTADALAAAGTCITTVGG